MWHELFDIEGVVPINHVLSHIKAVLVVGAEPGISIALNIVVMRGVVRADDFLDAVTFFEFQLIEVHEVLQYALTALILSYQLNQLINDPLEIGVSFVTQLAVSIKVHEELHSLTFRQTCLADESQEEESPSQYLHILVVQVDVQGVLSRPARQRQSVRQGLQNVANVSHF